MKIGTIIYYMVNRIETGSGYVKSGKVAMFL